MFSLYVEGNSKNEHRWCDITHHIENHCSHAAYFFIPQNKKAFQTFIF